MNDRGSCPYANPHINDGRKSMKPILILGVPKLVDCDCVECRDKLESITSAMERILQKHAKMCGCDIGR